MKYQDLVYFGYTWEDESKSLEKEFMDTIKERFDYVEFKDAFNDIKGYRQEVYLKEGDEDAYKTWILANGWHGCSMSVSLIQDAKEIERLIDLVRVEYPECIKD